MDHLPLPHRSRGAYPKVRCLCGKQDSVTGKLEITSLSQLVERAGEDLVEDTKQLFINGPMEDVEMSIYGRFIQSWLWFGTIETVFKTVGISVDLRDWVTVDDADRMWLNTRLLPRYLWYWVAAETFVSKETQLQHCRIITDCLSSIYQGALHVVC